MVNENNSSNIDFFDSMRKIFDSVDLNRSGFAPYERVGSSQLSTRSIQFVTIAIRIKRILWS